MSRRGWAYVAGLALLGVAALTQLHALSATYLRADPGIQFHLVGMVAHGEGIPIRDFEHGWNYLGWYINALGYLAVGGHATLYAWYWGVLAGPLLAGAAVLTAGWRLRLPPSLLLVLAAGTLLVTDVPHGKYAIPALWVLALLPVGRMGGSDIGQVRRPARPWWLPLAVRFALAAITISAHIDLAVMLIGGTALFDLFAARGLPWRRRLARCVALALGAAVAFGGEIVAYAAVGVSPSWLVDFLVLDAAGQTDAIGSVYHYSFLQPVSYLSALYPATLVLPFIPLVWRRLSDPTRLVASLNLTLALTAIRKPDAPHLEAATTLLVLLAVLVGHDLYAERAGLLATLRRVRPRRVRTRRPWPLIPPAFVGIAWFALAVGAGFQIGSVFALVALVAVTLLGVLLARSRDAPWASLGAVGAGVALTVVGALGISYAEARGPEDDLEARVMAAALADDVDRCVGPQRLAWVVPEPLGLYNYLDLDNPTPFFLFWPGFVDNTDRVLEMIHDDELPVVVEVEGWPSSMRKIAPVVTSSYQLCADVTTPSNPRGVPSHRVRIWVDPSAIGQPARPVRAARPAG